MQLANEQQFLNALMEETEGWVDLLDTLSDPTAFSEAAYAFEELNKAVLSNDSIFHVLQNNALFWQKTGLGRNKLFWDSIHQGRLEQPWLSDQERADAFVRLSNATSKASQKAYRALAYHEVDNHMLPGDLHHYLTNTAFFEDYATRHSFNTDPDKTALRQKMLKKWLAKQIATADFNDIKSPLIDFINSVDPQTSVKLKEFAAKAYPNHPVIAGEIFSAVNPATLAELRMQAVERIVEENKNLDHMRALADIDVTDSEAMKKALGNLDIHPTFVRSMTSAQKNSVKTWAQGKIEGLQNDKKTENLQKLNTILLSFAGKPENFKVNLSIQTMALRNIFNKLSLEQQQSILDKLNAHDSKLLARLFQATSINAIKYYLSLTGDALDVDLKRLIQPSINNTGLADLFLRKAVQVDAEKINQINFCLNEYYNDMKNLGKANHAPDSQTAYNNFKTGLKNRAQIDLNDANFANEPILSRLEYHAYTFQAMELGQYYTQNKQFCDYLLAVPGFNELVYKNALANPKGNNPNRAGILPAIFATMNEVIDRTGNNLLKARDVKEFQNLIANDNVLDPIAPHFANMMESDFISIQNELRKNAINKDLADPQDETDAIAKKADLEAILRRDNETFLKPKREEFRETRKSVNALIKAMNAYNLDLRAFTKEFASEKTEALKTELTELVDVVEKTEALLEREQKELEAYKASLALDELDNAYPVEKDNIAGKFKKFKDSVTGDRAVRNHLEVVDADIQRIQKTRDELAEARRAGNFNPILPEDPQQDQQQASVLLAIDSMETKSKENRRAKCQYAAKVTVDYKAVDNTTNYQTDTTPLYTKLEDLAMVRGGVDDDFEPALQSNQMMEMRINYHSEENQEFFTVVTREVEDNGHSKLTLRKADPIEDTPKSNAMCKNTILTMLEDAMSKLKPGEKLKLQGDADWVAQAWVAAKKMGLSDRVTVVKSSFNPNDRSAPSLIGKTLFPKLANFSILERSTYTPEFGFKSGTPGARAEELFENKGEALKYCRQRIEEAWALRAKGPLEAQQTIKDGISNIKVQVEEEDKREFRPK